VRGLRHAELSPAVHRSAPPIILHAHIPKTAGTTFQDILQYNFGDDHLLHWSKDPLAPYLSRADLEGLVDRQPTLTSISSHNLRLFWPEVRGRQALAITFLRSPTSHFLSLLRYTKREWDRLPEPAKRWWPENTLELGLRDLADSYLVHLRRVAGPGRTCPQTRFFCPVKYTRSFWRILWGFVPYGYNSVWIASRELRRFFFVGIVEEFEASLRVLQAKLARQGIEFTIPGPIWANRSAGSEEVSWLTPADPVGVRVLETLREDERLYRRFRGRFQAEIGRWSGNVDPRRPR
jgi:hypothetical protein